MKLEHEFYKLPLNFDVELLKKELAQFTEDDWRGHPSDYQGNLAIPLISVNGEINNIFAGPMKPTKYLDKTPYISEVISSFKSVVGRSRLMRLEPNSEVPIHSDFNYHWYSRVRIHVPITSTPDIIFHCGDQQVHMSPGEAWIFDAWKMHRVVNPSEKTRVHLVIDTTGSPEFWDMCKRGSVVTSSDTNNNLFENPELVEYKRNGGNFQTENFNVPLIMTPGEMDALVADIINDARQCVKNDPTQLDKFSLLANSLKQTWRSIWSLHGPNRSGWKDYETLIFKTEQELPSVNTIALCNGCNASQVLFARVLKPAYHPELDIYYNREALLSDGQYLKDQNIKPLKNSQQSSSVLSDSGVKKTGRNDPCPCGSGKKYKKCHGK